MSDQETSNLNDHQSRQRAAFEAINVLATECGALINSLFEGEIGDGRIDARWLNIAQTDLQKGFMELRRAIGAPNQF